MNINFIAPNGARVIVSDVTKLSYAVMKVLQAI